MSTLTFETLIQLKQERKIGWCEFALHSEHGTEYLQWCDDHGVESDDVNAELFLDETEEKLFDDFVPAGV